MDVLQQIHGQLDAYFGKTSLFQSGDLETPFSSFDGFNLASAPRGTELLHDIVSQQNTQLSALAVEMAHVDTAIQKLTLVRAKLEAKSALVRQSLLAHQALASSTRRIPPEVWGEIFYHCLPKSLHITPRVDESPLVLTKVCRYWRTIVISTPTLWSSLSVSLQKTYSETYRRGCDTWLGRAKSMPLTLRIVNDFHMFDGDSVLVPSAMLRWLRYLITCPSDLWWHGPSLPTLFIPETEANTRILIERLRITSHRDIPSFHLAGPAKSLRFLSLQCPNYSLQTLDRIELPWDQLTELNMHFALFDGTLFLQLLTRCTRLHTFVASCVSGDEDRLGVLRLHSPGSVAHPLLRRLEIKVIRAGLDLLFRSVTLPMLEELDVCFCYRERDVWPHVAFMDMVRRSRCPLSRLIVRSNKNAVLHFKEYVETIPGLIVSTFSSDRGI